MDQFLDEFAFERGYRRSEPGGRDVGHYHETLRNRLASVALWRARLLCPLNSMIRSKILLRTMVVLAVLVLSIRPARAQQLSLGILGGGSPTSGFPNKTLTTTMPGLQGPLFTKTSSDAGDYLVGGTVEVRLPKHLSIEADGIYRPLNFRNFTSSVLPGPSSAPSNTVLTWEFPVLLKGRFVRIPVLPSAGAFAEVGPSFRLASNRNDTRPSNRGATGGLGVETMLGPLSVSPTLRYTRWSADPAASIPFVPRTAPNQVETLIGLRWRSFHRTK